eukprot:9996433-Prorocentrum_lima.AAC.1
MWEACPTVVGGSRDALGMRVLAAPSKRPRRLDPEFKKQVAALSGSIGRQVRGARWEAGPAVQEACPW